MFFSFFVFFLDTCSNHPNQKIYEVVSSIQCPPLNLGTRIDLKFEKQAKGIEILSCMRAMINTVVNENGGEWKREEGLFR